MHLRSSDVRRKYKSKNKKEWGQDVLAETDLGILFEKSGGERASEDLDKVAGRGIQREDVSSRKPSLASTLQCRKMNLDIGVFIANHQLLTV